MRRHQKHPFITALFRLIIALPIASTGQTPSAPLSAKPPASTRPPSTSVSADLPPDYRAQVVKHVLKHNPNYGNVIVSYADPARVLVHSASLTAPVKEMTAVIYDFTPYSKEGAIYFMIMEGSAALFEKGILVDTTTTESRQIEWPDG